MKTYWLFFIALVASIPMVFFEETQLLGASLCWLLLGFMFGVGRVYKIATGRDMGHDEFQEIMSKLFRF